MMLWGVIVALVLLCIALFVDGRRRELAVLRDWELALGPRAKDLLGVTRARLDAELAVIDLVHDGAREHRGRGRTSEALRLFDQGCLLIESYCPDLLRSVAALSVLSRMAAAMAPPRPLRPQDFRLRELERLAFLNQFAHQFVVTTGERFRMRLYFLARGISTLVRCVTRVRQGLRVAGEPSWEQLAAATHDVRSLSDAWHESFRLLLVSLTAERKH
jgi:hypothetical protein